MQEEMDVGVDESGHESERAEVDDARIGGMRDGGPDGGDAVALDEDFAGRDEGTFFHVEEVRGVEDERGSYGGRRRGLRRRVLSEEREREQGRE